MHNVLLKKDRVREKGRGLGVGAEIESERERVCVCVREREREKITFVLSPDKELKRSQLTKLQSRKMNTPSLTHSLTYSDHNHWMTSLKT